MVEKRSILIVEDEPLIAMLLEDFIVELGHEVSATCDSVEQALLEVDSRQVDLAILDVNLRGEHVWPVAAALRSQATPFVFASGGFVELPPEEFADTPMIEKPYTIDGVLPVITEMLAVRS